MGSKENEKGQRNGQTQGGTQTADFHVLFPKVDSDV
jgi:hypothetical protein